MPDGQPVGSAAPADPEQWTNEAMKTFCAEHAIPVHFETTGAAGRARLLEHVRNIQRVHVRHGPRNHVSVSLRTYPPSSSMRSRSRVPWRGLEKSSLDQLCTILCSYFSWTTTWWIVIARCPVSAPAPGRHGGTENARRWICTPWRGHIVRSLGKFTTSLFCE